LYTHSTYFRAHLKMGIFLTVLYLLGVAAAIHAIFHTRTSQGTIAWVISLITIPFISIPMYALFGPRKFQSYIDTKYQSNKKMKGINKHLLEQFELFKSQLKSDKANINALENLAQLPFTSNNGVQLLIDGQQAFPAMLKAINESRKYILIQFYIVRDDEMGIKFKDALIAKAREGVEIFFLYDSVGSHDLPNHYIRSLKENGIHVVCFNEAKFPINRFQMNFRNHRKILITDGLTAFVGGLNLGNEYIGISDKFNCWRDTHTLFTGPCVQGVQLTFVEDWFSETYVIPELNWTPEKNLNQENDGKPNPDKDVLVLSSGPIDDIETGTLFFLHLINSARKRLWIASPYFIPDIQVISALQLAVLRGVDVRILLPGQPDNKLMQLTSFASFQEVISTGVKIYHYQPGFMHQKVLLIDNDISAIGTANLGNRSFRLNFELMMLIAGKDFASEVEKMLIHDFELSQPFDIDKIKVKPFLSQLLIRAARLVAPLQ